MGHHVFALSAFLHRGASVFEKLIFYDLHPLQQRVLLQEELEKRKERGEDVGVMAQFSAMKSVMGRLQTEMKKDR